MERRTQDFPRSARKRKAREVIRDATFRKRRISALHVLPPRDFPKQGGVVTRADSGPSVFICSDCAASGIVGTLVGNAVKDCALNSAIGQDGDDRRLRRGGGLGASLPKNYGHHYQRNRVCSICMSSQRIERAIIRCGTVNAIALPFNRLIINVQPRSMKSILVSVMFPCWVWSRPQRAAERFMTASYSAALATKHSRDRSAILMSPWFQRNWPLKLRDDANRMDDFSNLNSGSMSAVSVGGSVTGRGAKIIIIDDLISPQQADSEAASETGLRFYDETLSSRLDDRAPVPSSSSSSAPTRMI